MLHASWLIRENSLCVIATRLDSQQSTHRWLKSLKVRPNEVGMTNGRLVARSWYAVCVRNKRTSYKELLAKNWHQCKKPANLVSSVADFVSRSHSATQWLQRKKCSGTPIDKLIVTDSGLFGGCHSMYSSLSNSIYLAFLFFHFYSRFNSLFPFANAPHCTRIDFKIFATLAK